MSQELSPAQQSLVTMDFEPEQLELLDLHLILKNGEQEDYTITPKGILFNPNIALEKWIEVCQGAAEDVERTGRSHAVAMFRLGDALRFGDDKFSELHAQGIDLTRQGLKLHAKTIQNAAWIAGRVAPEIRHVGTLSFTHHEYVAPLPPEEQDEFLNLAENENLTTPELKAKIRERHPAKKRGEPKAKKKKGGTTTEAEALEAGETVLAFLLDAVGTQEVGGRKKDTTPYKDWPVDRKKKWAPFLEEILKFSRRCIQNGMAKH